MNSGRTVFAQLIEHLVSELYNHLDGVGLAPFLRAPLVGLRLQSLLGLGSRHCYGIITPATEVVSAIALTSTKACILRRQDSLAGYTREHIYRGSTLRL